VSGSGKSKWQGEEKGGDWVKMRRMERKRADRGKGKGRWWERSGWQMVKGEKVGAEGGKRDGDRGDGEW
jgi:hypothetical protein